MRSAFRPACAGDAWEGITFRRGVGAVLLVVLLLGGGLRGAEGEVPPAEPAPPLTTFFETLPSAPLAFVRIRPDDAFSRRARRALRRGPPRQLERTLHRRAQTDPKAAIFRTAVLAAVQEEDRPATVTCVLLRSPRPFGLRPRVAALLKPHAGTDPWGLAAGIARAVRLVAPKGRTLPAPEEPAAPVFAGVAGPYLVLAEDAETRDAFSRDGAIEAPLMDRARAIREDCPGSAWGYADGVLLGLLPFLPYVTDLYVPQELSSELRAIRAVGVSVRPGDASVLRGSLLLASGKRSIFSALAGLTIDGKAGQMRSGPWRLHVGGEWDHAVTWPRLCDWATERFPAEAEQVLLEWDAVSMLTGAHIGRDGLGSLAGTFDLGAVFQDPLGGVSLSLGLRDPAPVRRALERASIWGEDLAARGLVERHIASNGPDDWIVRGLSPGACRFLRLHEGPARLVLSSEPAWRAPGPEASGQPPAAHGRLRVEPSRVGLRMEWTTRLSDRALETLCAIAATGVSGLAALAEEPPSSYAAEGLRAIALAEGTYRALRLGRFNGLEAKSYQPEFWRLMTDVDRRGTQLSALPEILARARYPDGRPWHGVLYGPVRIVGSETLDWTRSFAFAAVSRGLDGWPAGLYAVRQDGVVYRHPDRTRESMPASLPPDLAAAEWIPVTHDWQK